MIKISGLEVAMAHAAFPERYKDGEVCEFPAAAADSRSLYAGNGSR